MGDLEEERAHLVGVARLLFARDPRFARVVGERLAELGDPEACGRCGMLRAEGLSSRTRVVPARGGGRELQRLRGEGGKRTRAGNVVRTRCEVCGEARAEWGGKAERTKTRQKKKTATTTTTKKEESGGGKKKTKKKVVSLADQIAAKNKASQSFGTLDDFLI